MDMSIQHVFLVHLPFSRMSKVTQTSSGIIDPWASVASLVNSAVLARITWQSNNDQTFENSLGHQCQLNINNLLKFSHSDPTHFQNDSSISDSAQQF